VSPIRLGLAILAGAASGVALAVWAFGADAWRLLVPPHPSLAPLVDRLATGTPLPTDLLALACLAAIAAFALWDLAGAWTRRRELRRIRRELGFEREAQPTTSRP
jgi:hypothetical protein